MVTQVNEKTQTYVCENCDFKTCHKNDFKRHCLTIKHKSTNLVNPINTLQNDTLFTCQRCNKTYNSHVGLWKHRKKCTEPEKAETVSEVKDEKKDNKLVDYLLNENKGTISN